MTKRHRWSALLMALALVACDEPEATDAGVDAMVAEHDGGETSDGGHDAGTDAGSEVDAGPVDPPALTSATPTDVARGAALVLAGTDLRNATAVTIGGTAQTIGANDDESITIDAVAIETPLGEQEVVVTTAGGDSPPITVTVIEALGVAGATAVDSVTVTVMFTRELDASSVDAADFTIEGLAVSAAAASGSNVTLTTDPQAASTAYTVAVAGVADIHGNALTGASSAAFTGFTPDAPTIVTISAGQVVREYSELTITGTNLTGATVTIGGATQPISSNTGTEIVAGPIAVATPLGTQAVMVTTPGGSSGSMNVDVLERFRMVPPATATTATEVTLTFNREVDTASVDAAHFTIPGLTVSAASASGATVTLTTSEQTPDATYTVSAGAAVLDMLGTPVTADTVSFLGFRPPPPSEFIVVRVGDGVTPLDNKAAPVFLERRSITDGSLIAAVPMPVSTSGANLPFTLEGTRVFEGSLSRSEDGRHLALAGFQSEPGLPATGSLSADTDGVARVVAIIDAADFGPTPSIDTSTTLGSAFNTTGPWGAVIDGTTIWAVGGFGGVHTVTLGGSSNTQVHTSASTSAGRAIGIFAGQLYYASSSTSQSLLQLGTGLPTEAGATATPVFGPLTDPYSFAGFDLDPAEPGIDTFYQADTGIERWVKSGGVWSLSATFAGPIRHLACVLDGTDVMCVGSESPTSGSPGKLYFLRDVGASSSGEGLMRLPNGDGAANTNYRGVAFPPVP